MKIAIDAMGGDHAPQCVVDGAVEALNEYGNIEIILVGKSDVLEGMLSQKSFDKERLSVVHASEVIEMEEATSAIKNKPNSSLVVALNLVKEGKADVILSAGSTGAVISGATLILRRIKGIKRPALAPVLPTMKDGVLLIDCGANVDTRPEYLAQFGLMGSIYMNKVMGIASPRVGLINNGAEEGKGNAQTKEAYQRLKEMNINFVGNVEGRDIASGNYDVLVCDGFVGNVAMKFMEGMGKALTSMLKEEIMKGFMSKVAAKLFLGRVFRNFKAKMDYKEYGGALLLGVNGGVIKTHGSADARCIKNTIRQARDFIEGDIVNVIKEEIMKMQGEEHGTGEN